MFIEIQYIDIGKSKQLYSDASHIKRNGEIAICLLVSCLLKHIKPLIRPDKAFRFKLFETLMIFLKEIFEKVNFEKYKQTAKLSTYV